MCNCAVLQLLIISDRCKAKWFQSKMCFFINQEEDILLVSNYNFCFVNMMKCAVFLAMYLPCLFMLVDIMSVEERLFSSSLCYCHNWTMKLLVCFTFKWCTIIVIINWFILLQSNKWFVSVVIYNSTVIFSILQIYHVVRRRNILLHSSCSSWPTIHIYLPCLNLLFLSLLDICDIPSFDLVMSPICDCSIYLRQLPRTLLPPSPHMYAHRTPPYLHTSDIYIYCPPWLKIPLFPTQVPDCFSINLYIPAIQSTFRPTCVSKTCWVVNNCFTYVLWE